MVLVDFQYKQTLTVRYNTADYSAKNECLYSDFGDLLTLQEKNGVKICLPSKQQ